jgi:hypothetical protein
MQKIFAGLLLLCLSLLPVKAQDYARGTIQSALNITAATVIKPAPGQLVTVSVITGTAAVYDGTSTGGNTVANQIGAFAAVGVYKMDFPYLNGLVVIPAGGVTAVAYQ